MSNMVQLIEKRCYRKLDWLVFCNDQKEHKVLYVC